MCECRPIGLSASIRPTVCMAGGGIILASSIALGIRRGE